MRTDEESGYEIRSWHIWILYLRTDNTRKKDKSEKDKERRPLVRDGGTWRDKRKDTHENRKSSSIWTFRSEHLTNLDIIRKTTNVFIDRISMTGRQLHIFYKLHEKKVWRETWMIFAKGIVSKLFRYSTRKYAFPICSREACLIVEQVKIHEDNFEQRTYSRDSTIAYLVLYHENEIRSVNHTYDSTGHLKERQQEFKSQTKSEGFEPANVDRLTSKASSARVW